MSDEYILIMDPKTGFYQQKYLREYEEPEEASQEPLPVPEKVVKCRRGKRK